MYDPTNERETIELFKANQSRHNWRLAHLQTAFPDAVIENEDGVRLVIEFEYKAHNFQKHGHDPLGCDLIVCWDNDWNDAPLPVWELRGNPDFLNLCQAHQTAIRAALRKLFSLEDLLDQYRFAVKDEERKTYDAMDRCEQLEAENSALRARLNLLCRAKRQSEILEQCADLGLAQKFYIPGLGVSVISWPE